MTIQTLVNTAQSTWNPPKGGLKGSEWETEDFPSAPLNCGESLLDLELFWVMRFISALPGKH